MSHRATAWAYRQQVTPTGAKFVLVALADFADEGNSCYPGQERLATMTGQSVASVQRHLDRLEAAGLLTRHHRQASTGHRTSDRYVLDVDGSNPADCREGPTPQIAGANTADCAEPTLQIAVGTVSRTTSRTTSSRERAHALPEDWKPADGMVELGRQLGLDVDREVDAFRAHALANDRRQVRWDQSFRLWLLGSARRQPPSSRPPRVDANGREVAYE